MLFRARPITSPERHSPKKKASDAGVHMPMNETVYLFALSVPALLEALVAQQPGPTKEIRPSDVAGRAS